MFNFYKKNKYGNKKTVIDGMEFDSIKEKNRYVELKYLKLAGKIMDLVLQPRYLLHDKFEKNGIKYRAITYIADFEYYDVKEQKKVIEDVKSDATKTDVYKIKKKLFEFKFKKLTIIEI